MGVTRANLFSKAFKPKKFYRLLGPAPAPLSRLKDQFRYHLIIKYDKQQDPKGEKIREEILSIQQHLGKRKLKSVKISIDVDPIDLF